MGFSGDEFPGGWYRLGAGVDEGTWTEDVGCLLVAPWAEDEERWLVAPWAEGEECLLVALLRPLRCVQP